MNKPVCEAYDNGVEMGARGSGYASEEALVPSADYMAIPVHRDGIEDTVTMKEQTSEMTSDDSRLKALQAAIEEGEASGDFDGFDPVRNLAELNAWHDS